MSKQINLFFQLFFILCFAVANTNGQSFSNWSEPYLADENTIALWHFDEENGTQINDYSTNNNNGTSTNTNFVPSMSGFGNAIEFYDNPIGTILFGDFNLPQNEGTIEYWIKPEVRHTGVDHSHFFIKGINGHSASGFTFYNRIYDNGMIDFGTGASGNDVWRGFENAINFGTWQHVAFTWNEVSTNLYLNGQLIATKDPFPIGIGQTTQEVAMGQWGELLYPTSRFIGLVDEFRISNIAREFKPVFAPINYCIQANQSILLDNYTTILGVNSNDPITVEVSGSTNLPLNGIFVMYYDINEGHKFSYFEAGSSFAFTPGDFDNSGYKIAPFLVVWDDNTSSGSIDITLSNNQSATLLASNALRLKDLTQFPISNSFEDGKMYRVEINGSPQMPMQGVFVIYVDNNITKGKYLSIGESLSFKPGSGENKFCAFQVDWSTIGDNYYETCVNIYEIENSEPVALAGDDQILECEGSNGTFVTLDGSNSYDPDDDQLSYSWFFNNEIVATEPIVNLLLLNGEYNFTLVVNDSKGAEASDDILIKIEDTTPPILTVNGSFKIWPVNHKYVDLNIGDMISQVSDGCIGNLSIDDVIITNVTSDEPEDDPSNGDGSTYEDIIIYDGCKSVGLRAERLGESNGRVYTITLAASDESGNIGTIEFEAFVPHDKKDIAIKDETKYLVEGSCEVPLPNQNLLKDIFDNNNLTSEEVPNQYLLNQNYPNPFNPSTSISFSIPQNEYVNLTIYDVLGNAVAVLENEYKSAGSYSYLFDASHLSSGIYFYSIRCGSFVETKKMILLK